MKLFLIPCPLAEDAYHTIPSEAVEAVRNCQYFMVENIRTARRFISGLKLDINIRELNFFVLDKKTKPQQIGGFFSKVPKDQHVGVISEAGCPGIADPGALAVEYAHTKGIEVVPITGPSSILLALMASGFNGQNFAFHGYLPVSKGEKVGKIKALEKESIKFNRTQIFMETPYRNNALLEDLLANCNPNTKLCVACNLTSEQQFAKTYTVREWKKHKVDLHKKPTMFVMQA